MKGKHVLISGGTSGIGRATALALAHQGAVVTIIGRNEHKSRETVDAIRAQTGNPQVAYLLADLSSTAQTLAAAQEFRRQHDRLDVLINNAGAIFFARGESADGIENTFALNHLVGYFLLTQQLLDLLRQSAPARIINVSSGAHEAAKMAWDDLELRSGYSGFRAYAQSKLANVLFTYELARRLHGTDVTVNALHPGVIATNFGATNNNRFFQLGQKLFKPFLTSVDKGAATSVFLASAAEVEGVTSKYFQDKRARSSAPASDDEASQRRLWQMSEDLLAPFLERPAPAVFAPTAAPLPTALAPI